MAELLVKAVSVSHADPVKDRRGCYKRGMPVVVMPDNHPWGLEERLPKFVVIKFPLISVARVQKYIDAQMEADGTTPFRRRMWQIRWLDLPNAVRNKLQNTGQLIIKATDAYTGTFDNTWAQVKDFFQNLQTGLNETADL